MLCTGSRSTAPGQVPLENGDAAQQTNPSTVFDRMFDRVYRIRTLQAQMQRTSLRGSELPIRRLIQATGLVGTIHYMSPEMINREPYFESVDWWSCGVLFFECVTRKKLFEGIERFDIARRIVQSDVTEIISAHKAALGPDLSDLLLHMLDKNVDTRYDSRLIKRHRYFNGSHAVEPYMVGRRFPPVSVDRSRVGAHAGNDSTLPSSNNLSFRDLCTRSSEYRPRPLPPDKLTDELKSSLKQSFYSDRVPRSSTTRVRSNSKKDNSKSLYSQGMPTVNEEAALDEMTCEALSQNSIHADNDGTVFDICDEEVFS